MFSAYWGFLSGTGELISTVRSRCSLGLQGAVVGRRFRTSGPCYFKMARAKSIRIGQRVTFIADHRRNRVGLTNPVILETWGDGEIEIGDGSGGSSVVISSRSKVTVGKRVLLGGNVRLFDNDFHALDPVLRRDPVSDRGHIKSRPIHIGDDVLIGTSAMVLKGVTVGEKAIIGAGSVVACDVPAGEIWSGNPACRIGRVTEAETIE